MERAVLQKEKSRYRMQMSDICCAMISLLLGSIVSPLAYVFVFVYCAFSYMRSSREATIVVFVTLLISLTRGTIHCYLYALGFTCFFIIVHLIRLFEYNLYEWIGGIVTLILIPFSVQQYGFTKEVFVLPVAAFLIMRQLGKEYDWIQLRFLLPEAGYGLLVFGAYLAFLGAFPQYASYAHWVFLAFLGVVCEPITFLGFGFLAMACLQVSWMQLLLPFCISVCRDDRINGMVIIIGIGLYTVHDVLALSYFLYCFILLFIKREKLPAFAYTHQIPVADRLQEHGVLKRQMLNYASIFHSLSEYYATMSNEESEMLSTMAEALRYQADVISKTDQNYGGVNRIINALEGYQYSVDALEMDEPREGFLQIDMDISNIKRGEIKTTLQPLMEALLHRKLQLQDMRNRRFLNGFHITFSDAIPFHIEAQADSIKNAYTGNGDTFSVFRFRQSLVCMISDGMGNGERAQESSRLITSIFQRMMISGLSQDAAIRCINKLIQSDTFATLDVLCFNYALGIAYISKSAACPTYLIRNHRIYEISGNALPVGIVSMMQPDCFSIPLQDDDSFIMMSDGIEQHEFYEWMRERTPDDLEADVALFRTILQRTRRKDDSTFIITNISSRTG